MLPSKEEIAICNKMIAKFMGVKKTNGYTLMKTIRGNYKENRFYEFPHSEHGFSQFHYAEFNVKDQIGSSCEGLMFHEKWSWLMPVVEKIETIQLPSPSMTKVRVEIKGNACRIFNGEWNEGKEGFISFVSYEGNSKEHQWKKTEATWLAVVKFIEYYNKSRNRRKK